MYRVAQNSLESIGKILNTECQQTFAPPSVMVHTVAVNGPSETESNYNAKAFKIIVLGEKNTDFQ